MKLSYEKNRIAFSNIFSIIGKLRINSEKKFYKSQAQARAYFYLFLKGLGNESSKQFIRHYYSKPDP
jgi:hypothetical protein